MAETIDQMVRETNAKIVTDRGLKLAMDPKITMTEDKAEIESVIDGKTDLAYTVALEVVPPIVLADFKSLKLEKLTTTVSDEDINDALQKIADQNRPYAAKAEGGMAASGDRVTSSFTGSIDGVPFEGGTGEDVPVTIGSNPSYRFEDQLIGIAPASRTVMFPANYA
jgi:trigger factor